MKATALWRGSIGPRFCAIAFSTLLIAFTTAVSAAAPAEAHCVTSACKAKQAAADQTAGKSSSKTSKMAAYLNNRRKHAHHTASRQHLDTDTKAALPVRVADARAEMLPGASAASKPADDSDVTSTETASTATPIEVVNPDQLNDLDRAVTTSQPLPPAFANARAEMREDSAWSQTSLIGKAFIVFGVLLTLASAARMLMA